LRGFFASSPEIFHCAKSNFICLCIGTFVSLKILHCKDSEEYFALEKWIQELDPTPNKYMWKYGISDTVPSHTGYYGYNDTTEVVVELPLIFL